MRLRKLEQKDAPLMLEWMHDKSVVRDLQANFVAKTMEDCLRFIKTAQESDHDVNLAIVDDSDEYMGTVSLKHIHNETAEFAITIRAKAMGKGISKFAMVEIIRMAFEEYGLKVVYWCVSPYNERAVRFYDKNQYRRFDLFKSELCNVVCACGAYKQEQLKEYYWYIVERREE